MAKTMPRLLILLTLPKDVRDYYAAKLGERFPELTIDVVDHHSKAAPFMSSADILVTFGPMLKDDVFRDAPNLRWIQALGTGVDGITDQPSLSPSVVVTNIRGIHGAPVSEAALMSMLALSRDLPRGLRCQSEQSWTRFPAKLLDGKTVGIFGVGLIAEALAPKCKAFGMTVVGFSSTQREVVGIDRMYLRGELIARAGELDYLVLLVPYAEDTRLLIDARVFAAMKPTSYLVNLARGGVVDEDALIKALKDKTILSAGLDVFADEPKVPQELMDMENVVLLPHVGSASHATRRAMDELVANNIISWFAGKGPITPVPETPPKKP